MSFIDERKKEFYYKRAKAEGYRSRSAFKLEELQKKFYVIHRGDIILDLGAAPGGWSQIASKYLKGQGMVFALDKRPIRPFEDKNIEIINMDMRNKSLLDFLKERVGTKADLVLSDLAGDVTGNWGLDADRQNYLVEIALDVCDLILKEGGTFVTKVFRGPNIKELENEIHQRFEKLRRYRPKATRKKSAEEFFVCTDFRGKSDELEG